MANAVRQPRLYSLFSRIADKRGKKDKRRKWRQVSEMALPKYRAVRFFQDALLAGLGELRPVETPRYDGTSETKPYAGEVSAEVGA